LLWQKSGRPHPNKAAANRIAHRPRGVIIVSLFPSGKEQTQLTTTAVT
jgi:hypothetical protein